MHLEHLHLQVLSIVTEVQLKKVFQRQSNFDLRRLLEGESDRLSRKVIPRDPGFKVVDDHHDVLFVF